LGQIGPLEVVSEGSIGSNLRRIEATTGTATLARFREAERQISEAAGLLRATPDELTAAVERKLSDYRELESRLRATEQASLAARAREVMAAVEDGTLVARFDGLNNDQLRELAVLARQMGDLQAVVIGGSPDGSRAALVAVAAKGSEFSAPDLIKDAAKTVGGGGGGRNPELASAGGKDASRLDEALERVRGLLKE
jgi:alanyl-tRNA synthetase